MSLVFTPKIPTAFTDSNATAKPRKLWHAKLLVKFIDLRALGVSIEECASLVGHTLEECVYVIEERNLRDTISIRRHVLIKDIMR